MSLPPPRLETPRLHLRTRTLGDLDTIVAMDTDEEIRRYIGGPLDPIWHAALVRRNIVGGRPPSHPAWTIEWKDRPGFLGMCALNASHLPEVTEISWQLLRISWGRCIATEATGEAYFKGTRQLNLPPAGLMAPATLSQGPNCP